MVKLAFIYILVNGFPRAQEIQEPEDAYNSADEATEAEGVKSDYYAPGGDYSDYSYAEGKYFFGWW